MSNNKKKPVDILRDGGDISEKDNGTNISWDGGDLDDEENE